MPPFATQGGPDPEPTRDWEVYSMRISPAQLIGWVQATSAKEACQEVALAFSSASAMPLSGSGAGSVWRNKATWESSSRYAAIDCSMASAPLPLTPVSPKPPSSRRTDIQSGFGGN